MPAGDLDKVQAVDMSAVNPGLAKVHISVACDVTNPLCGEKGASRVYGPQKGATPEMVEQLDKNLAHFAHIIKRSIGADVIDRPGRVRAAASVRALWHSRMPV